MNRLNIIEAYYLFLSDYHEGQWSDKYRRLCRMNQYFKPGPLLKYESLSDDAKEIYDALVEKERN